MLRQHVDTPAKIELIATMLTDFRLYMHYHIKATKSYLHSRMRQRVDKLLQGARARVCRRCVLPAWCDRGCPASCSPQPRGAGGCAEPQGEEAHHRQILSSRVAVRCRCRRWCRRRRRLACSANRNCWRGASLSSRSVRAVLLGVDVERRIARHVVHACVALS